MQAERRTVTQAARVVESNVNRPGLALSTTGCPICIYLGRSITHCSSVQYWRCLQECRLLRSKNGRSKSWSRPTRDEIGTPALLQKRHPDQSWRLLLHACGRSGIVSSPSGLDGMNQAIRGRSSRPDHNTGQQRAMQQTGGLLGRTWPSVKTCQRFLINNS
jgi:hypothetical protein